MNIRYASGPFAEETKISMFGDPKVYVELSDQASRISTRGRAGLMKFRTGRHRRHVGEAREEAEMGMGGGEQPPRLGISGYLTQVGRRNSHYKYDKHPRTVSRHVAPSSARLQMRTMVPSKRRQGPGRSLVDLPVHNPIALLETHLSLVSADRRVRVSATVTPNSSKKVRNNVA